MPPTLHRACRLARRALPAAALLAIAAAAPTPALAGAYEQVSRLSGAQGESPILKRVWPLAVSDGGRYAVFSAGHERRNATFARDIVANATDRIADGHERLLDVDTAEQTALVSRWRSDWRNSDIVLRPIGGGPEELVYSTTKADWRGETDALAGQAVLSGDGTTVALYGMATFKVVDVPSGEVATYPIHGAQPALASISDDGAVITGLDDIGRGFRITDGRLEWLGNGAINVSPNGRTSVQVQAFDITRSADDAVVVQRDGEQRSYPFPKGYQPLLWVSPGGSTLAFATTDRTTATQLDLDTGEWSDFGGLATSGLRDAVLSRSGRYALIAYGLYGYENDAVLVDLTGGDLPGEQEPPSVSSYVSFSTLDAVLASCGNREESVPLYFHRPLSFLPLPRTGKLTVQADGTTLAFATVPPWTHPWNSTPADEPPAFRPFIPIGLTSLTITAEIVMHDGFGPSLRETQTIPIKCD